MSERAVKRVKFVVAIVLVLVLGFAWEQFADRALGAELPAQKDRHTSAARLGCHMGGMPCPSWAAMKAEQFRRGRIGHTRARAVRWSPRVERMLRASYRRTHTALGETVTRFGVTDWLKTFEKHVTCGVATFSYVGDSACYRALSAVTEPGDRLDGVLQSTNKSAVVCGGHAAIGFAFKPWAGWWAVGAGGMDCLWGRYAEYVN